MKKILLTVFLTILFTGNSVFAGDVISHGIQGFALHAVVAKLLGADKASVYTSGAIGGLLGMYPDLAGAYGNVIERDDYVRNYISHRSEMTISFTPAVRLHLWVDSIFHNGRKGWKPEAWIYETIMVVLDVFIVYYLVKWIEG